MEVGNPEKKVFAHIHSNLEWRIEEKEDSPVRIIASPEFDYAFMLGNSESLIKYILAIKTRGRDIHLDMSRVNNLENGVLSGFYTACRQKTEKEGSKLYISGITRRQEAWLRQTLPETAKFDVFSYKEPNNLSEAEQGHEELKPVEAVEPEPRAIKYTENALRDLEKQYRESHPRTKSRKRKLVDMILLASAAAVGSIVILTNQLRDSQNNTVEDYSLPAVVKPEEKPILKPTSRPGATPISDNIEYCWGGELVRFLRIYRENYEPLEVPLPEEYNKFSRKIENIEVHSRFTEADELENVVYIYEGLLRYMAEFKGISADSPAFQSLSPEDRTFAVKAINDYFNSRLTNLVDKLEGEIKNRTSPPESVDEVF